jgi:hypothetical protein
LLSSACLVLLDGIFHKASLVLHTKRLDGTIPELLSERVNDLAGRIRVEVNRTICDELGKLSPFW